MTGLLFFTLLYYKILIFAPCLGIFAQKLIRRKLKKYRKELYALFTRIMRHLRDGPFNFQGGVIRTLMILPVESVIDLHIENNIYGLVFEPN
jgi:hypothetical protein